MPDLTSIAASVGELLKQSRQTIAVAESSAAGLISASLVAVPGASAYYVGGSVIYTRVAQRGLLRVPDEAMADLRASTEAYAMLNAQSIRELLGTTWGLAETGASGPTGNQYGDASGHACFAVAGPIERSITVETGDTDREANMWVYTRAAIKLLEECLGEAN